MLRTKGFLLAAVISVLLVGAFALVGCAGQGASSEAASSGASSEAASEAAASEAAASEPAASEAAYEIDYGTSELYTQADMDAAIDLIMAEFNTWKGAQMKKIGFTDDATCKENVEYANEFLEEGDTKYDQAIVFSSSFHSPSGDDAKNTAWEPDTDYDDWTWILARTGNGDWNLLTWGYA